MKKITLTWCVSILFSLLHITLAAQCPQVVATSSSNCFIDSVQLNASAGFTSYTWQPAANVSNPNNASPYAYATGTYTVTATAGPGPNMVTNPDFSMGNVGFTSGMNNSIVYTPCNYYVSPDWFGGVYPQLTDHTPTNDNMYMAIDGCNAPTMIWQESNFALQQNTDYTFSFWASQSDVVQPIFEIHFVGDVTGDNIIVTQPGIPYIGVWTWDQYGVPLWNSGANSTLTIYIVNLAVQAYGNDVGLDDFSLNMLCPPTTDTVLVTSSFQFDLGSSFSFCDNPIPVLDAGISNATYLWNTGETTQTISPDTPGDYWVAVSAPGCNTVTDTISIEGSPGDGLLYFPNAFTPNRDGLNERFAPVGNLVETYQLRIFNRWGELIFESNDIALGWDGTYKGNTVPDGVYVYVIEYQSSCAFSAVKQKIGHVSVLR